MIFLHARGIYLLKTALLFLGPHLIAAKAIRMRLGSFTAKTSPNINSYQYFHYYEIYSNVIKSLNIQKKAVSLILIKDQHVCFSLNIFNYPKLEIICSSGWYETILVKSVKKNIFTMCHKK